MTQTKQKESFIQFIKFTLFSISAGVIQYATFSIMYIWLSIDWWPSYLTGLVLSVIWNFTFNRKFTFKSAANIPVAMSKVAFYYAIFTPLSLWWGTALETASFWGPSMVESGANGLIVTAGTMIINFVTEFLFTKYVVYHNQINTALKKDETLDTEVAD